jgi:hypothetical protein
VSDLLPGVSTYCHILTTAEDAKNAENTAAVAIGFELPKKSQGPEKLNA